MSDALSKIEEKLRLNDLNAALGLCEREIQRRTSNADIYFIAGQCALKLWKHQQAIELLTKAGKLATPTAELHHLLGLAYRQVGDMPNAIVAFEQACSLKNCPQDTHLHRAECLLINGCHEAALPLFEEMLACPSFRSLLGLSTCHLELGQIQPATRFILQASNFAPPLPEHLNLLNATLLKIGYAAAEQMEMEAVRKVAIQLSKQGNAEAAESLLRFLVEVEPHSTENNDVLINFLIDSNRSDEARHHLHNLLADPLVPAELTYALLPAFIRLKLHTEARQIITNCDSLAAQQPANILHLAAALSPAEGRQLFAELIDKHSDSAALRGAAGDFYNSQGNQTAGNENYDLAVQLYTIGNAPTDALREFIKRCLERKDIARAGQLFPELTKREGDTSEMAGQLAQAYSISGQTQVAAQIQQQILDSGGKPSSSLHCQLRDDEQTGLEYDNPAFQAVLLSGNDKTSVLRRLLDTPEEISKIVCINFWGRSGSFLLSSLFDNHPEVLHVMPSHSMFDIAMIRFEFFADFVAKCGTINGMVNAIIADFRRNQDGKVWSALKEDEAPAFSEALAYSLRKLNARAFLNPGSIFRAIHVALALVQGKKYDTVPAILFQAHHGSSYYRRHLRKILPETFFISCVRYPPRTFDSHLYHHFYDRPIRPPFELPQLLLEWLIDMGEWVEGADVSGKTTIVRFEDVHNHTEFITRWICKWLGISWDKCLLESTVGGTSWSMQGAQAVHQGTRKMTEKDFSLQVLSRWDELRVRLVFNQNMAEWGYVDSAHNEQLVALMANPFLRKTLLETPLALFATATEQAVQAGHAPDAIARQLEQAQQLMSELWRKEFERREIAKANLLPMLYREELEAYSELSPFNGATLH